MEKAILIFIGTFIIVGAIHLISMKTMQLSDSKKARHRKYFWYLYSIYFLSYGIYLNYANFVDYIGIGFVIIALMTLVLNLRGKLETKSH
ncbi:hypothetical protein [Aestuariivivens sediminicola]|uniref:hypothetical protein n=1 Tax=Aestuariivivens sediminicola TaxID=2913560 RepID=UPI001F5937C9|nr:hypothetical protein [Aestuariivivens sediminicola]